MVIYLSGSDLEMGEKKDLEVIYPSIDELELEGKLKHIGGSTVDAWNDVLIGQSVDALWLNRSDQKERQKQIIATVGALAGIKPRDEIEGMLAANMLAAHHAAMECYRRAMIGEQTFEGHKENLNQANRLSRTMASLIETLDKHRGKGQQKVTVEHVHVHDGGQAIVGTVEHRGGGGASKNRGTTSCKADCRCT